MILCNVLFPPWLLLVSFSPILGLFLPFVVRAWWVIRWVTCPYWGGCWDFLGTINTDDPCGCGYCRFGLEYLRSVTALYGDFCGYPHVNGIGSGSIILSNKAGSSSMSLDSYPLVLSSRLALSRFTWPPLCDCGYWVLVLTLLFIRPMYLLKT